MPKLKSKISIPGETLALYEKLVATNPDVERKGATVPYTSANGTMFSFLTANGTLALRLPPDQLEPFFKKFNTTHPVAYGKVMRDWAAVPDSVLANTKELRKYFDLSLQHAANKKSKAKAANKGKAK
jgi:TfoX/Sxy family transcriptional regulator of competence genes